MPVATVVGGTPTLFTIPPNTTSKEVTLKDMIIRPSAMAIIGTHDSREPRLNLNWSLPTSFSSHSASY
jgi:hypothetical protein